ncbi:SDR family NAD(P)-dependent oxidoreductase [Neolewinella persica]|uniref:SDR family NAD(P)-dependent oxidoreductase n=1 Tax=Neolewinella persica TaxID=70998 RepID=UPI00036D40CE|nr:SDR family oxidoreductase [Neolewinella persica]
MSRQNVLITGATRGIGRACVEYFVRSGWEVTGVARSATALAQLREELGGAVQIIQADLTTKAGIAAVPQKYFDAIILNAATFAPGELLRGEDKFEQLWKLNVRSNHRLMRRILPELRKKGRGHLVVIGSLGTDYWPPHLTAYVATKYALRGLFLGWEAELKGSGIRTTLVAPGATLTSSWDNEEPPLEILLPRQVAEFVGMAIEDGREGRLVIEV